MRLSDFSKKYKAIGNLIKRKGDVELYPPQAKALKSGFLNGKNLLLSSPTSSGKTLVAETAIIVNHHRGGKAVYLVPLKSLAMEKFRDFTHTFENELSVGISIGDLTSTDEWLKSNDLIICSYEKFDSLMRHRVSWLKDVNLVIFDEVHLMNDAHRGPVIEVLLTRLKLLKKWIVALSATVGNPRKLGKWLDAITITSNFRPVKLLEGVMYDGVVKFKNHPLSYEAGSVKEVCDRALGKGKQALVFTGTRRSAESVATKLSADFPEKEELIELSNRILHALPSPTSQCRKLAECVRHGVAFNHAGLPSSQKTLVEEGFRNNLIKVIACTTVLAYGVSLPAYLVVLRDFKRFGIGGMSFISKSEYLQIAGRAGRSGYDRRGESVLFAGSDSEKELAWNEYLCSKPDDIVSKLSVEPVLRFYALALICNGAGSIEEITEFFKKSFFGFDYGNDEFLSIRIRKVVEDLASWKLVKETNSVLVPTLLGKRTNELYIDPLSAKKIADALQNPVSGTGLLHLASSCHEVTPLRAGKADYEQLINELAFGSKELMLPKPNPFDYEFENYINAFKTAIVLNEWIEERGEDYLLETMGVAPGTLQRLIREIEWMLYSIGEISRVIGIPGVKQFTNKLAVRIKYGVKEDLLPLVSIKGVGRVRARKLYSNGIRTISDIKKAGISKLSSLIGPATASKLLKFVSGT